MDEGPKEGRVGRVDATVLTDLVRGPRRGRRGLRLVSRPPVSYTLLPRPATDTEVQDGLDDHSWTRAQGVFVLARGAYLSASGRRSETCVGRREADVYYMHMQTHT